MEIDALRDQLAKRRDLWGEIASAAGISRKTVYRIASRPSYMPNLQTFLDIQRALENADSPATPAERAA